VQYLIFTPWKSAFTNVISSGVKPNYLGVNTEGVASKSRNSSGVLTINGNSSGISPFPV